MNHPVRRNPIASFFVGLWDVMNFTRRLIFNLVFFGFLFCCCWCSWWRSRVVMAPSRWPSALPW